MFIKKWQYDRLKSDIREIRDDYYKLEREHTKEVAELRGRLGNVKGRVDMLEVNSKAADKNVAQLREAVGVDQPGYASYTFYSTNTPMPQEVKSFNLVEKVEAILQHLGLAESVTLGNKLVTAPKKKASK